MNKPVLSIILQTRYAFVTGSSAAITELATTKTVAAAKNNLIENPVPLRRHGARACFVLQGMLRGFALTVWKYNASRGNLFAPVEARTICKGYPAKGQPTIWQIGTEELRDPKPQPSPATASNSDISQLCRERSDR
ncbi:hypothetical protein [Rhizobium sp. P44RR-XXIV]|uniref:hypothetical protein n=1 Tax=Rhizobium sp. P44RR-XXIV TaxID=1921145 RepID=UPI001FEE0C22|nr:hypothetical protein [Rhizobium sp. P44RR-XXIV]